MSYFKEHKYLIITIFIVTLVVTWFILISDGEYGTTLFFTIPSSIGFLIGYSVVYNGTPIKKLKKGLRGFIVVNLCIAGLSGILIALGLEGAICILMAYPFLVIPTTVSYILGLFIGNADKAIKRNTLILIILANPTTYIYDSFTEPIKAEIKTELVVNNSKEHIWKSLSTNINFENKPNLLFQKGISYPKSIKLEDKNNQKSYLCITNNDTINLDITKFKTNSIVEFKPRNQTIPMKELSPYHSIDAKHLHNYFFVNYGQITLDSIDIDKTRITAITSYNYKIAPKWYWKLWSNYIIDQMQLHVLTSIDNTNGN